MIAADTSLVVAAFASWHESHAPARRVLDEGVCLIAHCALETYSVLTRLPPPHRVSGAMVRDFIAARFAAPFLQLDGAAYRDFMLGLADRGINGGAVYDALVSATAMAHGVELATCDRRALRVYEAYGLKTRLLG